MRETQTIITDDLSPEPGVLAVVTNVTIGIRGRWYLVDLGEDSLKLVEDLFSVIKKRGRRVMDDEIAASAWNGTHLPRPGFLTADDGVMTKEAAKAHRDRVRAWAETQPEFRGRIKGKGYIPVDVRKAYEEAHGDGA